MPSDKADSPQSRDWRQHGVWLGLILLLALLSVGTPLFRPDVVLSAENTDIAAHFLPGKIFGFGELAHGHLPLWNPYTYGGAPFLGQLQTALLYFPNVIFLFLPVAIALNWSIALHVALLGSGMYFWGINRKLLPEAAFLSGVAAMLGGFFFLHIYAGHLSNVCTVAWVPLVFLGIDGWVERRNGKWILLAAGAAAMQVCAGHPQYVYYTALVAGLYSLLLLAVSDRKIMVAVGFFAIYPLAVAFSAAQLFPALALASESVRSGGTTYDFATMFSLPPENFLTLLNPWILGDMHSVPYWGRCYLWEMELYMGLGMLFLACWGLCVLGKVPKIRFLILLVVIILLALGGRTPLYNVLYHVLPGFSGFRGTSKFFFLAGIFSAHLTGIGFDQWLRGRKPSVAFIVSWIILGAIALFAGLELSSPSSFVSSWWQSAVQEMPRSSEVYLAPAAYTQGKFLTAARSLSALSLEVAGVWLVLFSLLALAARRWPWTVAVFAFLAVLELFVFAKSSITTFKLEDVLVKPVSDFLARQEGDFRILNLMNPDACMALRREGVWGYDPSALKRYADLVTFSQGQDPNKSSQYVSFKNNSRLLGLLRCKIGLVPQDGKLQVVQVQEPFPRFFVVAKYKILQGRDRIFDTLADPDFNLREEVILESKPDPDPNDETGPVHSQMRVLSASTDEWTLEVITDRTCILVMTDSYSRDWSVTALPDSVQSNYNLMPADYALRAIPLTGGHHLLRISYTPSGFRAGVALSLISIALALTVLLRPSFRRRLAFEDYLPAGAGRGTVLH